MTVNRGEHVGPYRVLDPIGSGGMATVYAAIDEHLDRKVAVKRLSLDAAREPHIVARFIQEARALARLDHPGVVRIFGCDRDGEGQVYLAMEYLDGPSLRKWLEHQPRPGKLSDVFVIIRQIADAMTAVHEAGIIHRDLKPENIILSRGDAAAGEWQAKVLDFGIAKVPPSEHPGAIDTHVETQVPILLGTATYMAPEQCRNAAEVTDRADVYALGVVLFEMLAGQPPFVAKQAIDVISMHLQSRPPAIRQLVPSIPAGLDVFLASMLAKDPDSRPTMRRVREVLGEPWENRRGEPSECPLPGLQAFTTRDAELFFGRQVEAGKVREWLEQARRGQPRLLVVEGPSGVGKTSLVQAAVLPALEEDHANGTARWRIGRLLSTDDPVRELARAIVAAYTGASLDRSVTDIEQSLRDDGEALQSLVAGHTPDGCVLLLVIEHLEELFAAATPAVHQFSKLISRAFSAGAPLCVLATLRVDHAHRLDSTPDLAHLLETATRYSLSAMDEPVLIRAIEEMTQRAGMRLGDGLAARMVRDASGSGSSLPLLGHTLRGLWTPDPEMLVTHERYEQSGGVLGALAHHAEELLDGLGQDGYQRAKWLVLSLVQVGRGVPDSRRSRTRQEVLEAAGGDALASEVLARLSGVSNRKSTENVTQSLRLVTVTERPIERIELVHDILLRQVPTIAGWIDSERALLERHADLEIAAETWEQAGFPADGLPSGTLLDHYARDLREEAWRRRFAGMASTRARRFVTAARQLDRRRRFIRQAWTFVLLALVATLGVTVVYVRQAQNRAEKAQKRAEINLRHVIDATDDIVSDADWELARLHGTLPVRKKMLEHMKHMFASLLETEAEVPDVPKQAIRVEHRWGDLAWHDDTLAEAKSRYQNAWQMIEGALTRWPGDDELIELLALNHSKQGKVAMASGHLAEAGNHFAEALLLMEPRLDRSSDDSRRTLATSYSEQAELELERGQAASALEFYARSLELLPQGTGDAYDDSLRAFTLSRSGTAARLAGNLAMAAERLERALAWQRAIVDSYPGDAFYQWTLGSIHVELAELRTQEGKSSEAAEHYRCAYDLASLLHQRDPTHKRYALLFGAGLRGLEVMAQNRALSPEGDGIHRLACELFGRFAEIDREDLRFVRHVCH